MESVLGTDIPRGSDNSAMYGYWPVASILPTREPQITRRTQTTPLSLNPLTFPPLPHSAHSFSCFLFPSFAFLKLLNYAYNKYVKWKIKF